MKRSMDAFTPNWFPVVTLVAGAVLNQFLTFSIKGVKRQERSGFGSKKDKKPS